MEIAPQSKFARIQILHQTFCLLSEFYQRKGATVVWATDGSGSQISPDQIWGKYVPDVNAVRNSLMYSTDSRLDPHKIIALTERVILEVQPLMFVEDRFSANDHYRLNAEYAVFFGVQFLTRWHQVYSREPFYPDKFLHHLLLQDAGYVFLQEHIKLLSVDSPQPFPVFWASQLWFLLEQWGLTHMEKMTKFPIDPSRS